MMKLFSLFKRKQIPVPASWHQVDKLQSALEKMEQVETPLTHLFTPGLYAREISVPAGTVIVTKIHKTEHPFVMLTGAARVWTEEDGIVPLKAPYVGVTKPGTRRVLYVTEDCRWITFHATKETDLEKIERVLIQPRDVQKELGCPMKELMQ